MSSMVGCVTNLDNKVCDDLGALFWFDNFGGCFVDKCDQANVARAGTLCFSMKYCKTKLKHACA